MQVIKEKHWILQLIIMEEGLVKGVNESFIVIYYTSQIR